MLAFCTRTFKTLTAIIIVARVQPGTSKGITDLLLPPPSSGFRFSAAVPLEGSFYTTQLKLLFSPSIARKRKRQ